MQTYISFLRGINMAGHYPVKMADLLSLYKNLGLNDAETYIQSGNVIFSDIEFIPAAGLALEIEKSILEKFGYSVPVLIRTIEEISEIIAVNPFLKEKDFDPSRMAAILLYNKPTEEQIQKVTDIDYPPDKFKVIDREIFVYCPKGFGRTKLYTNFFEKKMGVTGTARNWKTITSLLQIAEKK
jgi:uncharacterized protein (DUF1697 family)